VQEAVATTAQRGQVAGGAAATLLARHDVVDLEEPRRATARAPVSVAGEHGGPGGGGNGGAVGAVRFANDGVAGGGFGLIL
jgi:hypothetical protein